MDNSTFESALSRLEYIVKKLESENLTLDESLKLFEEGVKLSAYCNEKLDKAQGKVTILTKNISGELSEEPFNTKYKENIEDDI
ncbi:MAG: exodeoxyribonuclease VII small subunit [Xylanivirga thermophila]|jgi:exodeoxyribonuclease VII small subunit|uniref:exodeoxyribonuclease VII small subunit n=1 Tax=Xylanivirga thermophila TaxID=2496273 RepID=UPI00101DBE0F|nr:exodeoxyribonuclease VII small subunit [Xylanivirga thermophila]